MYVSRLTRKKLGVFSVGALAGASIMGLVWQTHALPAQVALDEMSVGDPTRETPSAAEVQLIAPSYGDMMEGMPSIEELQKMAPELMGGYPSDTAIPSSSPSDQFVGDPTQKTPSAAEMQLIAPSYGDMMQGMPSYEELQQMAPSDLMQHVSQDDYNRMIQDVSNADISSVSAAAESAAAGNSQPMPSVVPSTQDAAVVQQLTQTITMLQEQIAQLQNQIATMQEQAAQASMSAAMSASSEASMHAAADSSSSTGWFGGILKWFGLGQ